MALADRRRLTYLVDRSLALWNGPIGLQVHHPHPIPPPVPWQPRCGRFFSKTDRRISDSPSDGITCQTCSRGHGARSLLGDGANQRHPACFWRSAASKRVGKNTSPAHSFGAAPSLSSPSSWHRQLKLDNMPLTICSHKLPARNKPILSTHKSWFSNTHFGPTNCP